MTFDEIMTKAKLLKQMDEFVRNKIDDEVIFDYWLAIGIPDETDDMGFIELVPQWNDLVTTFKQCCKFAGII